MCPLPSQKKILVVTQHFWPENFRINDIVEGFLQDGIAVDVLCGLPNYPKGEWFPGYSAAGPFEEEWHGARLYRCKEVPRRGNTSVNIFLNYVSWPWYAAHALHRKYPAMTETMLARPGLYNDTVCLCRRLAEENPADTVLLQPDAPLATFEKDIKKLEWGYEMGYNMTCDRIDDIKALFV